MIRYAATIFVSAFLLFQVQPLIARYILPWFGGSAGVWSVTLLFFQVALLSGYAYAHLLISRFSPRTQMFVHIVLLGACVFTLPIIPPESLKPSGNEYPALRILLLLGASVGLPYFALSATGPLLQAWFARSYPERSPYALYALSNVGSMLALLSYPFVVEPIWGRTDQAWGWTYIFLGFAAMCLTSAVTSFRRERQPKEDKEEAAEGAPLTEKHQVFLWMAFAAIGTTLLLAFTNQVCLDVASVPFLWAIPLSLYLLSFILTFSGERWYPQNVFRVLMVPAMILSFSLPLLDLGIPLFGTIAIYMLALFIFCMVCHGEAFRLRPDAAHLTKFYLCISLGGALGGAFVALLAPVIFTLHNELFVGMIGAGGLVLLRLARDPESKLRSGQPRWAWGLILVLTVGLLGGMSYNVYYQLDDKILATRNFYGVFRIEEPSEKAEDEAWIRTLYSGTTMHGQQFMYSKLQGLPTSYYGTHSGIGGVLNSYPREGGIKVGIVGLGAGTLAVYAKPGDTYRFYEINERVHEIALEYFKYLDNCEGNYEVVIGDARLRLEDESPQSYDVIVLDAFSSDSIPVHLLTAEAFELYRSHLNPGGVICAHISNRHLDLRPVLVANADHISLPIMGWQSGASYLNSTSMADWVIITDNAKLRQDLKSYQLALGKQINEDGWFKTFKPSFGGKLAMPARDADFQPWTDDYSNLFAIMNE